MRQLGIKVIVRTVEVDRYEVDRRKPVLLAICLPLDKQHLLGQSIRSVGFLRVAVPEIVLLEWNGRELRISTDSPYCHELLDTPLSADLHEVRAHHQVVVEEFAGPFAIGADPAYRSRQGNHAIWPHV